MKNTIIFLTVLLLNQAPLWACNLPEGNYSCSGVEGNFRVWFNPTGGGLAIGWPTTESTFIKDTQGQMVDTKQRRGRFYSDSGKFSCGAGTEVTTVTHEYIVRNTDDSFDNENAKMKFEYRAGKGEVKYSITGKKGGPFFDPGVHSCKKMN